MTSEILLYLSGERFVVALESLGCAGSECNLEGGRELMDGEGTILKYWPDEQV